MDLPPEAINPTTIIHQQMTLCAKAPLLVICISAEIHHQNQIERCRY